MVCHLILKSSLISSLHSNSCFLCSSIPFFLFFPWSPILFVGLSKVSPKRDQINLACSIALLWSESSISSFARSFYLSILPGDKADILAICLLILYCRFLSLILSSILMTSFYILYKRFPLTLQGLFDVRVASITKN